MRGRDMRNEEKNQKKGKIEFYLFLAVSFIGFKNTK